jgi:hypothetical protein
MNTGKFLAMGVDSPKKAMSVSSLWRSCYCFDADFIFSIGTPIEEVESVETFMYLPKRVVDSMTFKHYENFAELKKVARMCEAKLVAVEWPITLGGYFRLTGYKHPDRAIYLLGSEVVNESKQSWWVPECDEVVTLPTKRCLAAASMGAIVLYDRYYKELMENAGRAKG